MRDHERCQHEWYARTLLLCAPFLTLSRVSAATLSYRCGLMSLPDVINGDFGQQLTSSARLLLSSVGRAAYPKITHSTPPHPAAASSTPARDYSIGSRSRPATQTLPAAVLVTVGQQVLLQGVCRRQSSSMASESTEAVSVLLRPLPGPIVTPNGALSTAHMSVVDCDGEYAALFNEDLTMGERVSAGCASLKSWLSDFAAAVSGQFDKAFQATDGTCMRGSDAS